MSSPNTPAPTKADDRAPVPTTVSERGIEIKTIDELWRLAKATYEARMAPESLDSAEAVFIAMQTGMEASLTPMAALRAIYVVNRRPSWLGKAAVGLVASKGLFETMPSRRYEGVIHPAEGEYQGKKLLARYDDDFRCIVTLWRKGEAEAQEFEYSVRDAKTAGLWNPGNSSKPWATAPKQMLYWRAIGQGLDALFPDVLMNLPLVEVARDYPDSEPERFERARVVNPDQGGEADAEQAADPILERFEASEANGGQAGDVVDVVDPEGAAQLAQDEPLEPEVLDPEPQDPGEPESPAEAALGAQDSTTRGEPFGEVPEPEECAVNGHQWAMEGDTQGEEEPVLACTRCGVTEEQVEGDQGALFD